MFFSTCLLAMLPTAPGATQHTTAFAPTADGKMLFVAMMSDSGAANPTGFVCVWDLTKPELKAVVPITPTDVRVIQPTPDGKRFVVIAGNGYRVTHLEVYDTTTKKLLHSIKIDEKDYGIGVVSPDGEWIAYRKLYVKELRERSIQVWNAETGKHAEVVEVAAKETDGLPVFSFDSKRLGLISQNELVEFDLKTGKKAGGWKRTDPVDTIGREGGGTIIALPNGKGTVSVAPTGKRRQSYVVRIVTEKKDWLVAEFWDRATAPTLTPDGRLLIVSGGARGDDQGTFTLKLDADGNPEMEDRPEKPTGPWAPGFDKKVPAWRPWTLGEAKPADRGRFGRVFPESEYPGRMVFSPDGKRLFISSSTGTLRVYDTERREVKATLFNATPKKDEVPAWHILTATGEVVGSRPEVEALVKDGKKEDAVKVKEALGVK